ncbi:hypothetical protein [Chlamydia vaughanii]|uniref:hypothetical protein n=1 Tax=Chlamydia vaughanii TaxID=3112552 RepID=UPI0032B175C8
MACYLYFGREDLSMFSTAQKAAFVAFDMITFPLVATIIGVVALLLCVLKLIFKIIRFQITGSSSRGLEVELATEHLILIPFLGNILHGCNLARHAFSEGYAKPFSINSCIMFMQSGPNYLARVIKW